MRIRRGFGGLALHALGQRGVVDREELASRRGAKILNKVLVEKQIERPLEGNAELLREAWKLAQVNRAPEPPGDEAGGRLSAKPDD